MSTCPQTHCLMDCEATKVNCLSPKFPPEELRKTEQVIAPEKYLEGTAGGRAAPQTCVTKPLFPSS